MRTQRNLFALLGWAVWKLLALSGLRFAKDRLARGEERNERILDKRDHRRLLSRRPRRHRR